MKAHPSQSASELTWVGVAFLLLGFALKQPAVFAWGSALLVGTCLARGVTLLNVARTRAAGFEMVWRSAGRNTRTRVGERITLSLEVRNRDTRAVRFVHLRALASPHLAVELSTTAGEVPGGGRLEVLVHVQAQRVGRHGFFGLNLDALGAPGLYEVPLTFSNPFGVEVMPSAAKRRLRSTRGGYPLPGGEERARGKQTEGSYDVRQLRAYQSGDPLRQIAWKASARRGKLIVREFEREDRNVVWLLLDASVEHWAGPSGQSPLDVAIDRLSRLATEHLNRGDRLGLSIVGRERLTWLKPQTGLKHLRRVLHALSFDTACYSASRSTFDEGDCAMRVFEHLRPTLPAATLANIEGADAQQQLEQLALLASRALDNAPFAVQTPEARTPREGVLRRYLLAFGMDSPARLEPDQAFADDKLLQAIEAAERSRPQCTLILVCSPLPVPELRTPLLQGLAKRARSRVPLRWIEMPTYVPFEPAPAGARFAVADYSTRLLAAGQSQAGRRQLLRLNITLESFAQPAIAARRAHPTNHAA